MTQADHIIAISLKTKHDVMEFYGIDPARIDVVPLATNPSVFFPEPSAGENIDSACFTDGQAPTKPYFLFVGGRRHYKNFDVFVRAYAQSSAKEVTNLVVVGKAWRRIGKSSFRN